MARNKVGKPMVSPTTPSLKQKGGFTGTVGSNTNVLVSLKFQFVLQQQKQEQLQGLQ